MECPKCEREIKEEEKECPYCQYDLVNRPKIEDKEKQKVKRWCLGGLIAIVCIVIMGISMSNKETTTSSNILNNTNNTVNKTKVNTSKVEKIKVTVIDFSQMSKEEIESWCSTNRIKCSFTESYSETVAKGLFLSQSKKANAVIYQGDAITITYSLGKEPTLGQKNALAKAKSYLSYTAFSYKGLVEQLEFEGFSHEESIYGVDNCGADWNEQAAKKAKSYMSYSSFSRSGLIEQLVFEGFTRQQAEYGVSAVGY